MKRGRPRQHWSVPVHVWAMVELTRDKQSERGRRSVREAAERLASHIGRPDLEWETLRRLHKRYDRELREDAGDSYDEKVKLLLQEYRDRRAALGWDFPIEAIVGMPVAELILCPTNDFMTHDFRPDLLPGGGMALFIWPGSTGLFFARRSQMQSRTG